jgi:negative regulator of genetic competence, sporulation and motility
MNSRKHKQKENQKKKEQKDKLIEPILNFQKIEEFISEEKG